MSTSRSHAGQYALRVNRAMQLLEEGWAPADVARHVASQFDVSFRQGWRYVHQAMDRSEPLDVAEPKIVFTVKVPQSLVARVRATARAHGKTLSAFVSEALEAWLRRLQHNRPDGGQAD